MNKQMSPSRNEVMLHLGEQAELFSAEYLKPIETNWQASELLPLTSEDSFIQNLKIM